MTREEYYAGIEAYKNKLEHRAMDANAEDTAGKALENWKNQYLNQAINLRAKQYLASKSGRTDDASTYEKQLQILLDKMTNLKGVALSAKQALLQTIDQTATNKANVQFAKHSDEPEDGVLEHGAWKDHKYIRIENGRYIYADDLKKDASYAAGKAASASKSLANIRADKKTAGTDKETAAKLNENTYKRAAANLSARAEKIDNTLKNNLDKSAAATAKANEDRKERETKAVGNSAAGSEVRRQSDESAKKAQAEGEAMQAWKNIQKIKADAKKGEGESFEKAKAEGDAYQQWKNAQANKTSEPKSKFEEIKAQMEKETKEKAEANKKAAEEEFNKRTQAYKDEYDAFANKVTEEQEKAAKEVETKLKIMKEIYAKQKQELTAQYDEFVSTVGKFMRGEAKMEDLINSVEKGTQDLKESEVIGILTEAMPGASKEYIENVYMNTRKNKLGHSLNLTREEYYAGIEEYKRKKPEPHLPRTPRNIRSEVGRS